MDRALVILREPKRLLTILGLEHSVTGSQEDVTRQGPHLRFVVHHQDGLHLPALFYPLSPGFRARLGEPSLCPNARSPR